MHGHFSPTLQTLSEQLQKNIKKLKNIQTEKKKKITTIYYQVRTCDALARKRLSLQKLDELDNADSKAQSNWGTSWVASLMSKGNKVASAQPKGYSG